MRRSHGYLIFMTEILITVKVVFILRRCPDRILVNDTP